MHGILIHDFSLKKIIHIYNKCKFLCTFGLLFLGSNNYTKQLGIRIKHRHSEIKRSATELRINEKSHRIC